MSEQNDFEHMTLETQLGLFNSRDDYDSVRWIRADSVEGVDPVIGTAATGATKFFAIMWLSCLISGGSKRLRSPRSMFIGIS